MNYSEAEQFLYSISNLPREEYMTDTKHKDVYLQRVRFFLNRIGNPEKHIPHIIHVGGTSGKGSLVNFLHAILHKNGTRVGSMISPHPTLLLERWRIGGRHMTKKEFTNIVARLTPALDTYAKKSPYGHLSFFDLTTVIGLVWFAEKKVTTAVIEVGCGGRYDSTNVVPKKDIAVVTTIGLDHTHLLGKTKTVIAKTKAGIITPGSSVFTMERSPKINRILAQAASKVSAPFFTLRGNADIQSQTFDGTRFTYKGMLYDISCLGAHQAQNASLAIEIARSMHISERAIRAGLKYASQPVRMEIASARPETIILDSAHNPDKIRSTVETLHTLLPKKKTRPIHLVVGFSENKQTDDMIRRLSTLFPASVACTRNTTNHFRTVADPAGIAKRFKKALPKANIDVFLDPKNALLWAQKHAKTSGIILVTGSIFLAGELRRTCMQT